MLQYKPLKILSLTKINSQFFKVYEALLFSHFKGKIRFCYKKIKISDTKNAIGFRSPTLVQYEQHAVKKNQQTINEGFVLRLYDINTF